MVQDYFNQRKKSILEKSDKSNIGDWDEKIISLCKKINNYNNYYTTSSCSGRVVLIVNQDKKESGLFLKQYHDLLRLEILKKDIDDASKKQSNIRFKQEPPILHVSCKDLESALKLLEKAKLAGWKKSGVYSITDLNSDKARIILELNSTEKMDFPLVDNSELLVDDVFLEKVVEESNRRFAKSWKKIEDFEKSI